MGILREFYFTACLYFNQALQIISFTYRSIPQGYTGLYTGNFLRYHRIPLHEFYIQLAIKRFESTKKCLILDIVKNCYLYMFRM